MKNKFCFFIILVLFFNLSLANENNESIKTDILFLKIQELESEIANLRNKVESQDYLIEKLINEGVKKLLTICTTNKSFLNILKITKLN